MLSKLQLRKIRKALPKEGYRLITEKLSNDGIPVSEESVRKILFEPSRYRVEVIDAALSVIASFQEKIEAQKEQVKHLAT